MYSDKTNMFDDFGFKLVVVNSLLNQENSFAAQLKQLQEQYVEAYEDGTFECIPEMVDFFENLQLTEQELESVKELVFDGGEDIYFLLMPDWDGESDEFEVQSIGGVELLKNLESVVYTSMCQPELMEAFEERGIQVQ